MKNKGITLISLVVTVIVLLILAGISISMLNGDNGLLKRAGDARDDTVVGQEKEQVELAYVSAAVKKLGADVDEEALRIELNSSVGNGKTTVSTNGDDTLNVYFTDTEHNYTVDNNGNVEKYHEPELITVAKAKLDGTVFTSKVALKDDYNNRIIIPKGFYIADDSGTTVKDGIVIEDREGNQYVWVPVSNINHDGSNKIKVNSAEEEGVEITLGRYTFYGNSPGNPTLAEGSYQYADGYATPVTINSFFQELTTYRQSNYSTGRDGTNTTAINLKGFVESVRDNKGYYIARYEASYRTNGKAGSIQSTSSTETLALTSAPDTRTAGDLWNLVKQREAATACQDLYKSDDTKTTVNSDLMNSYAWDTAIVYIQEMGNTNYANASDGNGTLRNTGTTGDEKCKIFDMAGNEAEWTTEYSTETFRTYADPCVSRGGRYDVSANYRTSDRYLSGAKSSDRGKSFRSVLYL